MMTVGDVISYNQMCLEEGSSMQRGMNYRHHNGLSVILMSLRPDAPYADEVRENGRVLIDQGHDAQNRRGGPDPKAVDQPMINDNRSLTQNGQFDHAAVRFKKGEKPELVKVYEKLRAGLWTYNGIFKLTDAFQKPADPNNPRSRKVFKFTLELTDETPQIDLSQLDHNRMIPSAIKNTVWIRDQGQCVKCGSKDNLHFDQIIPYSKGGSSLVAENIQLLCARHNLAKKDRIE